MESYWGYSEWQDVNHIDNKAEIARSKMFLGNNYEDPLKNAYFSILASAYKIKNTIEPARHPIRGIRFIDFIREDFDIKHYGEIYGKNHLLRIFRDLLEKCKSLNDQIYHSIENPNHHSKKNNPLSKNITRHTGKQNLKDDIINYLFLIDVEKIIDFNKKNNKESKISDKYLSLAVFCDKHEDNLVEIYKNYKSGDKTKNLTFADIVLHEAPNYLPEKKDQNPDFERVFRKWMDEKDQIFTEAIHRVVVIKEKKSK